MNNEGGLKTARRSGDSVREICEHICRIATNSLIGERARSSKQQTSSSAPDIIQNTRNNSEDQGIPLLEHLSPGELFPTLSSPEVEQPFLPFPYSAPGPPEPLPPVDQDWRGLSSNNTDNLSPRNITVEEAHSEPLRQVHAHEDPMHLVSYFPTKPKTIH